MIGLFKKFYSVALTEKEKLKTFLFIVLNFVYVILDLLSIALILPVAIFLINGDLNAINSEILRQLIQKVESYLYQDNALIYVGLLLIVVFFIKFIAVLFINFFNSRFINFVIASIRARLFSKFLNKSYKNILDYNNSRITNIFMNLTEQATSTFYGSFLLLITSSFYILLIISFLFLVNHKATIIILILSVLSSFFYYSLFKKKVEKIGLKKVLYYENILKTINEFYGGFKVLKLNKLEKKFFKFFREKSLNFARIITLFRYINIFPKLSFEFILILILFGQLFILNYFNFSKEYIVSLLTILFIISLRLIPQIIHLFSLINKIKNTQVATKLLIEEFEQHKAENINYDIENLKFSKSLKLSNINFKYVTSNYIFNNLDLEIKFGTKIGVIGESGSGKSTLANIISGLLQSQRGKLIIDNLEINSLNLLSWQNNISIVEQDIFLFNDTIQNNITVLDNDKNVDYKKLEKAIDKAQLKQFINKQELGLNTLINQNSTNISGGEKQRLAIARALYKETKLLILDEATSAMDQENRDKFLNIIKELKNITIIIITHDHKNLSICSKKYSLEEGKLRELNF